MATIELYKSKVNAMDGMLHQAKVAVNSYNIDLNALKTKVLGINSSVCNSTISSISTASKTQAEQISALEKTQRKIESFINLVNKTDSDASSEISKRKNDFYKKYSYLQPECEKKKTFWDKICATFESVGEFCKKHWRKIVVAIEIVVIIACLVVPGLQGFAASLAVQMLKGMATGLIMGALIGGLSSWANDKPILEGLYQGALSGAMLGGLFGAAGAAGNAFGATHKICAAFDSLNAIHTIGKGISLGTLIFDTSALSFQVLKKTTGYSDGFTQGIINANQKCHSNTFYNISQTLIGLGTTYTGGMLKGAAANNNTCFIAGTMVLMKEGLRPIEDIKEGDYVLSANPDNYEVEEKVVLEKYIRKVQTLVHIIVGDDELVTTKDHPFYVMRRGFIEAGRLFTGDKIVRANGNELIIKKITIEEVAEPITVYNFKVDEYHNYFVGNEMVLVHNANQNYEVQDELTESTKEKIVNQPKGSRPDPSNYLSNEYIKKHLDQFKDGVSVIQSEWAYKRYSRTNGFVGVPDDNTLFVMPKKYCDEIISKANGNVSIIENELGFPEGYFCDGGGLVRIDMLETDNLNIRMPSGNETGANNLWIPGGKTSGGVPEAITDTIPLNETIVTKISTN